MHVASRYSALSPNLELASEYYWETSAADSTDPFEEADGVAPSGKSELLKRKFGEAAEAIEGAIRLLSEAFRQFPFHITTVYAGPQNSGPANLLYLSPIGYRGTMVGFPYDDYYYRRQDLQEKVLNCLHIKRQLA